MKVFKVKTQDGSIKEMTFKKVIRYKNLGKPVKILGVSKEIDKSYKTREVYNGNQR